jgi:hypothetical protein
MNMLAGITRDQSVEEERDVLGGGFKPLDSAMYHVKIELAYVDKSAGGALGLYLHLVTVDGEKVRQTAWITSGDKKGNKTSYEYQGKTFLMPGFLLADSLTQLAFGTAIEKTPTEERVISVYDSKEGKEVPMKKQVMESLHGMEFHAGIIKQITNKSVKTGDKYVNTNEKREQNDVTKFFDAKTHLTATEKKAGVTEATFYNEWITEWSGKVQDRFKEVSGSTNPAGMPGMPSSVIKESSATSPFDN